ncbi:MAG: glycerol-3-phosphate dehydrogenase/oxidase [Anaerolineales bacterium]
MMSRNSTLQSVKENPQISVLIIGAGINGIGTFRDLALQGVDCLIIDRSDFCSGASMASSHMLHGGIRYLENGEFRLVREALHERNNLLRNAPHLTRPLPTTIPIFKWFSGLFNSPLKFLGLLDRPAERGAVIIKLGLILYDAYVRGDSPMPGHRFDNRDKALQKWPAFNPDILFAATYYDGAMLSPERLALEILLDGEKEGDHAQALNYVRAVGVRGNSILLKDEISGEEFSVEPEIVINAGGPWIDIINQEIIGESNYIGGTKGSHLIVNHPELRNAIGEHEIFFEYLDGRIVLIFPYLQDKVMIGTTDLRIDNPDEALCTEEEINYILGMVPQIFPSLTVTREQIVFQFSGVRPLPPAKGTTGLISRDHSIEVLEKSPRQPWPILNLVGGKWTSYRALSEQVTDQVLVHLDQSRRVSTVRLPIGGSKDFPDGDENLKTWITDLAESSGIPSARIGQLFSRYGTRAKQLTDYLSLTPDSPLEYLPTYSRGEIQFLVEREMITHLDDFLLRRSKIAWTDQASIDSITELAGIIGELLGWDPAVQQEEINRAISILQGRHGVKL